MADVNKAKLQLRSGGVLNGDKSPSPATKLLINHGKPNFTIQRSPKAQNGNVNPLSPPPQTTKFNNNNDEFVVKSTTFNGIFKPSNISAITKQTLPSNSKNIINTNNSVNDNEASKVVLRRAKVVQTESKEAEEGNVPEFILRQRRIQERLANQNILDFENRRSGYFTQVMISPSSPNRQSFVETMASPAVKPGLEMPPPAPQEDIKEELLSNQEQGQLITDVKLKTEESVMVHAEPVTLNGQEEEEEEVAKAIEQVNKAVEGEDEDKLEIESSHEAPEAEKPEVKQEELASVEAAVTPASLNKEELKEKVPAKEDNNDLAPTTFAVSEEPMIQKNVHEEIKPADSAAPVNEETKAAISTAFVSEETVNVVSAAPEVSQTKAVNADKPAQNGLTLPKGEDALDNEVTISHANGLNGSSIPSPDPTGEKGANFESKTVVSFSQELGNDINKYPDTVKVVKEADESTEVDSELKELTKLKFEIKTDNEDIEVKPVLVTENI